MIYSLGILSSVKVLVNLGLLQKRMTKGGIVSIFLLLAIVLSIWLFFGLQTAPATPAKVKAIPRTVKQPSADNKPVPTPKPVIVPGETRTKIIKQEVPFAAQAPFGEWSDPRQQDGCEEAAALMAVYWARGETFTLQEAKDKILAIADWEQATFGNYQDTSAQDTVERIFKQYFKYQKVAVVENISVQDIISELVKGNLVIVPANGTALHNPYFTPPGPQEHMLVIIGYDYTAKEFITNEAGTRHGQDYRYGQDLLYAAVRDYPTGHHEPIIGDQKVMIVVQK